MLVKTLHLSAWCYFPFYPNPILFVYISCAQSLIPVCWMSAIGLVLSFGELIGWCVGLGLTWLDWAPHHLDSSCPGWDP